MANLYNNPSMDPADNNSLAGSIRFAFSKLIQKVNGMLPAQVISYDSETNRVEVQLMIALIATNGDAVPRPQIASIPVLLLGGGGLFLSFPLNTGDLGWVIANDRDISNFLSTYAQSIPNTNRISQFSDGIFVPDIMRGYTLASDAEGAAVLQNLDGTVSIAISDSGVIINSSSDVTINTDTATINAASEVIIDTNDVEITVAGGAGTMTVTGNLHVTGTIINP